MIKLLFAAGTAFLRSFAVAFLVFATGILAAPDLSAAKSLSIAALLASIVAGLRAVQVFVPQVSFAAFVRQPIAAWIDSFSRAALAALFIGVYGVLAAPDLATARSLGLAAVVGALTAGLRALQGFATAGESPSIGIAG